MSEKISFLEDYVLSSNRLKTTAASFNEDTEEYWQYSLLYILNNSDGGKDAQTQAFLKKLEKSSFKNSDIIKNLLFRHQLKTFDSSARKALIKKIKDIVGLTAEDLTGNDDDKKSAEPDGDGDSKSPDIQCNIGTKILKKGGIEVDTPAAIKLFLKEASEQYLNLADLFSPSAVDAIATKDSVGKLKKGEVAGVLELLCNSAPTSNCLLELVMRDLKENDIQFGKRAIHRKLTVDQLKKLGEMDSSLYKNLSFVQVMAGKLRPISDVKWQNNEAYCKAYLDKLRAFARGPLKHVTFKALILFNYLRFYEGVAKPDGSADIAAYQAAVYGNDQPKKKSTAKPKFPSYDKDTLAAYLSLPRRGAPFTAQQASSKVAASMATSVDTSFCSDAFPELPAIGDDVSFIQRALGYFFLGGDLTGGWSMVKKEWALIVFAKEKLMSSAGNDKFLKAQELAIRDKASVKVFKQFNSESQLRLFETNKKFYRVRDAVTIEYFTKNNPEIIFNIYQLNCTNYYLDHLSEIPVDIALSGAVPIKSMTKKYSKDKSIIRRADSVTIKSLAGKRGIFIVDLIGKNISCRCFIRKGELRFIYEQTNEGYDFYVFDENYNQIMKPRIYMDGVMYDVQGGGDGRDEKKEEKDDEKERGGKITLPYALDCDQAEQLIIIQDTKTGAASAVLRSFKRQVKCYELRGGFYIDRENLLSKQQAKLLIRANLYLCNEQTNIGMVANPSYVTLEFKTLDGDLKRDVRRVQLRDNVDSEIIFTVPTNLREISCRLDTRVGTSKLNISHSFKVNGIDACPFIADVFLLPNNKKGYYLLTVGKNGEVFENEKLEIELHHKFFRPNRCVSCTVTTDHNGLFELGKLENIRSIRVKPKNTSFFSEKDFNLLQDLVNVPSRICRQEGTTIKIPFSSCSTPQISIYDAQYSSDISKAATYKSGYVIIEKLPPGDYVLYIDDILCAQVTLHISGGKLFDCHLGEYVLSNSRILQLSEDTPLQITNVKSGGDSDNMEVQLDGYNEMTRCHVIVTSLLPVFTPYQSLCAPIRYPDVIDFVSLSNSTYTPTTKCDPEFMYILNRNKNKKTEKYNGNGLYIPSMIFGKYAPPQNVPPSTNEPTPKQIEKMQAIFKSRYENVLEDSFGTENAKSDDTSNVEFLPQPSIVFSNLKPDKSTGIVSVPDFKKSEFRCVQIIATDDDNTALLNYVINQGSPIGNDMPTTDIRLSPGFDPTKHYSPVRKIQCLNQDEDYKIEDINAATSIPFEKLSCLFDLYSGLIGEENKNVQINFEKFRPLTQWDKLSDSDKLDFYDENMCHEVNFFLYRRDRQFFENTIAPVLRSKLRKEFMDLFLLESTDLNQYGDPYLFSLLNTFEQILLCSSVKDGDVLAKATLRTIEESAALIPRNPKFDDQIFAASKYRNQVDLVGIVGGVASGDDVVGIGGEEKQPIEAEINVEMDEKKGEEPDGDAEQEPSPSGSGSGGAGDDGGYNPFKFDDTYMVEETGYFNVPGTQSTSNLIRPSKFWKDFCLYLLQDGGKGTFLSPFLGRAINNINEALLALAVTDLPLDASEPEINRQRGTGVYSGKVSLTAKDGPCVIFLEEMVESRLVSSTLSVHSNYFDPRDSSEIVHGEKVDKFVIGTFETRKIYGCRSVITNVSSVEQDIEVLLQIPSGSIAVNQSYGTKSYKLSLSPFMTERLTYYFYFPLASEKSDFQCFPVHINKNGRTIAYSLDERLINMTVVGSGSDVMINKKSAQLKNNWDFITSSRGTSKQIIEFLATNARCYEVELAKLGARLSGDSKFFDNVTATLRERGIYDECVWKYALVSDKGGAELAQYLSQQSKFLEYIHPYFRSNNFNYDPFDRFDWSLTEFSPLISCRTECDAKIQPLSDKFLDEYGKFLLLVAFKSFSRESISAADKLIFVQYLIYQQRIFEARKIFENIPEQDGKQVSALYYEYLQCYLMIYSAGANNLQQVLMKCMSWKAKPLPNDILTLWGNLETIAKEVEKPEWVASIFDTEFILQENNKNTQFISFDILSKKEQKIFDISFRNLIGCQINVYRVDLELLFSKSPFNANEASLNKLIDLIYPNEILRVSLPKKSSSPPEKKFEPKADDYNLHHYVDLPAKYKQQNIIIQIVGNDTNGKIQCVKTLNDNSHAVQFDVNNKLGQCRIVYSNKKDKENYKKPIIGAYCKVYSKNKFNQKAQFYKDGYTDIRGRFSYKKLSTNQLANSKQLAMFVQTPNNGSSVVQITI